MWLSTDRGTKVKICGLTTPEASEAAAGADYVGIVFIPPSPRFLSPATAAALATKIIAATTGQFVSTASLARGLKVERPAILAAFDAIEAADYRVMRVRGYEGGIEILGQPRAAGIALEPFAMGCFGMR